MMEHQFPDDQLTCSEDQLDSIPQGQCRPLDHAAVDRLLRTADAIKHAHPGLVFEDSVETLRQIREERMWELEHYQEEIEIDESV